MCAGDSFVAVHVRVTQAARKAASALAIFDGAVSVTYGELDTRSNALAAYLQSLRLGSDAVVGICGERSIASIIGALGVMKAGAGYLPLDPGQPRNRLAFTLRDARADVVLLAGDARGIAGADELGGVHSVYLDCDGRFAAEPCAYEPAEVHLDDLAYVIYTSGSTGQPKGVEITHAGLANLIAWHHASFGTAAADRASHIAAVGFDAAVWEVWPYLCAGASVHIAAQTIAREPRLLVDWLIENTISVAFVSTPMVQRLLDFAYPSDMALRILLTGADTLHRHPPANLPFTLYNNYGPTEATVVATSGRVEPATNPDGRPSIGRAIDNMDVSIRDERGKSRADEAEGEICIAGVGLARGYRGRPDLTAEKFVWITRADGSPVRIYRTGDRGRRLNDGRIDFLGRIDDQVKIRGFRVEPREVEAALNAYGGILECAVIAREFVPGDDRLVAYIVPKPGDNVVLADLITFLATRLPSYMVPSSFVELAALPLTANGKVDRAQLHRCDSSATLRARSYTAPRSATQVRVAEIVSRLLKLERVSVDDDFFMLGGHSLLGTQLIARLRDNFGVTIGLRFVFDSPTIAALALEVDRQIAIRLKAAGDRSPATDVRAKNVAATIPKRRVGT